MSDSPAPAALYRRYRPTRLSRLVGQDTVSAALTSALAGDRVGHAYLFSGPRGTGKTSTARILARSLNCAAPLGVEPCGTCDSCASILAGTSFDVVEIDAASNTGVDAIRDLIGSASLSPTANKRVFIIDEVHMLSPSASNALLKTLEEPPAHVVFLLATTDPQKVLPTVRSRTQHLEFRLVAPARMLEHLRRVATHAGLEVSEDVLVAAVRRGGGSVRDALSALDVLAATGVETEASPSRALLDALAAGDTAAMFQAVATAVQEGVDARTLAEHALTVLRDCFLVQMGVPELTSSPDDLVGVSEAFGARRTVQALDALGDAILAMRAEHDRRVQLEVHLSRFCRLDQTLPL